MMYKSVSIGVAVVASRRGDLQPSSRPMGRCAFQSAEWGRWWRLLAANGGTGHSRSEVVAR